MKGDFTRSTFHPERHYDRVLLQQGRVQLDADWNEELDIQAHLDEITRIDTIGFCGVPRERGGFQIGIAPDGSDLTVSSGRIYVDGILCELDATPVTVIDLAADAAVLERVTVDGKDLARWDWLELFDAHAPGAASVVERITSVDIDARAVSLDPPIDAAVLAALTASGAAPSARRVASYTTQPDVPSPDYTTPGDDATPAALDLADGTYLAYVDIWQRHVTALDDPDLLEPALGGVDTATRAKTVAQVLLLPLGEAAVADCDAVPAFSTLLDLSTGRLAARARPPEESTDLCDIPPDARYQGVENQLYRVEVHEGGDLGSATFKWSRENGSIAVLWTDQSGNDLTVSSTGRDAVLGFASGDLVELIDDSCELRGTPGTLVALVAPPQENILTIDPAVTVTLADFPLNPKVRRWDCQEPATVELAADNDGFLRLESGVEVRFEPGRYNTGDYWLIPARTATRDVEWPRDGASTPLAMPPAGILHHYCRLALVRVAQGTPAAVVDCRDLFPSLTAMCADDVCFDNDACKIPGATTVQDALDALCEESNLRRHKKHLHGWGIVCGLEVVCGPDPETEDHRRRHVTVRSGYAIDCEGNDLILGQDEPIDFMDMVEQAGQDLLEDGDGDVCLILKSDQEQGITFAVERHDPKWDRFPWLLAGTLLFDVYNDCIKKVHDFLREQLRGPDDEHPTGTRGPSTSILASLVAQVLNPDSSQLVYLSEREDEIMRTFYKALKKLLSSETFCAMFDDAHPFPGYPESFPKMDTIFGAGYHNRIRVRPGKAQEAYTVGGGLNPLKPSALVNRYDLAKRELVERIDPIAGTVGEESASDSGAGAVDDVAFSPNGSRIYVVAPTRNGQNTLFRAGRVQDQGVAWGELVTICGVRLVSLGAAAADASQVYAIGLDKGVYRFDPDSVDPNMSPIFEFRASGDLVMTADGWGYGTAKQDSDLSGAEYDTLVAFRFTDAEQVLRPESLGALGSDGIAVFEGVGKNKVPSVYVVVGPDESGNKHVARYRREGPTLKLLPSEPPVPVPDTTIRLAPFAATGMLLVTAEDDCVLTMIDMATHTAVEDYVLPVQVGPIGVATSAQPPTAYVLNYWSDTITVITREALVPTFRFPVADLAVYRHNIILAFRDLLGGFLQYLKDCFCDHFLVKCPTCTGDEKIYLACVSIRDRSVYKVCNFSRRKYVKSFPTLGYWMSVVPVMPLLHKLVEQFCCLILPDLFRRYEPARFDPAEPNRPPPRIRYSTGRTTVSDAQGLNLLAKLRETRGKTRVSAGVVTDAVRSLLAAPLADPAFSVGNLIGQPLEQAERLMTDRGMEARTVPFRPADLSDVMASVAGFFRTPESGDRVTLHEEAGRVRYFSSSSPGEGADYSDALRAKDAELDELRHKVTQLEARQEELAGAGPERLAAVESELQELHRFRDEVRQLLRSGLEKPGGGQSPP